MHDALKKGANAAWVNDETTVCKQLLDNCIKLNGHCDTLFSYRARVNARAGLTCEAINDARRAVSLWHRPDNHMLLSRLLHNGRNGSTRQDRTSGPRSSAAAMVLSPQATKMGTRGS